MSNAPYGTSDVITAAPDTSVRELARLMSDTNVGSVVIVDPNGQPKGIVTDRDLVLKVLEDVANPGSIRAEESMTRDPVTVEVGEGLLSIVEAMRKNKVRRMPLTRDGKIVAIVTLDDLTRMLTAEMNKLNEVIEAESHIRNLRNFFQ